MLKAVNIKWDTDGNKEVFEDLPTEMEIPKGMTDEEKISDWLSDETGFCHNGFELVENKTVWLQIDTSDDYDNTVKQFEVPEEWLLNEVKEEYGNIQNFLNEYTSDESDPIYCKAILDGVVLNETESR